MCRIYWNMSYILEYVVYIGMCRIYWNVSYILECVVYIGMCRMYWNVSYILKCIGNVWLYNGLQTLLVQLRFILDVRSPYDMLIPPSITFNRDHIVLYRYMFHCCITH